MKWMLIQPLDSDAPSHYMTALLQDLQQQYGFLVVEASDKPKKYAENENLIVRMLVKSQGKWGSWLDNKMKYNPIIKEWHIERILLSNQFLKVDSTLPQIMIVEKANISFKEDALSFMSNQAFSFVTYSNNIKEQIAILFPRKKIHFYNPTPASIFQPFNWEECLEVKEIYADGNDYFLVNSIGQPIDFNINLLKGFSIFKKWQKSSMKILFLTDNIQSLQEKVSNYKYREDVRIVNHPDEKELANIIASAYCTIHLPKTDSDNIFALQSAQCHVPLLLKKGSTALSWLQNNAFFLDEISPETLGQAFITMYKAENIRVKHIVFLSQSPITIPNDHLQDWVGR